VPELPEVENVHRQLAPVLVGARMVAVELSHPRIGRRNRRPEEVADRLLGRRVESLTRRGKFLLATLDGDLTLIIHLGMSGHVALAAPEDPAPPHTHFRALIDRGLEVRLIDPRTFGFVAVLTPAEMEGFTPLGPDVWAELPPSRWLAGVLAGRSASIKTLLLDQRIVAGLGNIYADEVLWRTRVHPSRAGGELSREEISRMRSAIRKVVGAAIHSGGTTLSDLAYRLPDGRTGDNRERLAVYGREGLPCQRCGSPIERMVIGGRSSYFCPRCQA
jgi:formamidopyrimidine-DNA glycosylase